MKRLHVLVVAGLLLFTCSLWCEEPVQRAIPVSMEAYNAAMEGQVAPSHVIDPSVLQACLDAKKDFNLADIYPKNEVDDQGVLGTCGAYASVNALELAWWRFNQSYQLNDNSYSPKSMPVVSFLTEPIYYAVKNEIYRRHSGMLNQAIFKDVSDLVEGTSSEDFPLVMVDMLKNGKLDLYNQNRKQVGTCQAKGQELVTEIKTLFSTIDATRQGARMRAKLNQEESSLNDAEDYLNLNLNGKSVRENIHASFERYVEESTKNLKKLKIRSDYFEQLGAYRLKLPQFQNPPEACDPQKLKNTVLRYLCSGIPTQVDTKVSIDSQTQKLKVDATSSDEFGHAMLIAGFKAATPSSPFKLILKNSHLSEQTVEVTPEDLCPAITGTSIILNNGAATRAPTSDIIHLPPFDPQNSYPIEEGIYVNGSPEWSLNKTAAPPKTSKPPVVKKH